MGPMRALVLVGLLTVACTRLNAAFDETATSGGEDDGRPSTADTAVPPDPSTTGGPATSAVDSGAVDSGSTGLDPETTTTLDGPRPDLPVEPTCPLQPSPGASIQLGDPMEFGGVCPTGMDIWTRVVTNNGGDVVLDTCDAACLQCSEPQHPLSVSPLVIGDLLPAGTCLRLEAGALIEEGETRCHWGALTIHDPLLMAPYVIVTARSSEPTPVGAEMLGEAIPDPTHAFDCECSALRPVSDCCEMNGVPSFWTYTLEGTDVHPGEQAPIELPSLALDHTFQLLQAQQLPSCSNEGLQLSWAVVATQ